MAYTNIDDPSAHFQTATYTGNGSNGHAITYNGNSDMQPDLLWFKNRDDTNNPTWLDSSRGVTNFLLTNSTQAEQSLSTLLSSFDTDGFTVNSNDNVNGNAEGIVAWGWKANGGTTVTNTDGSANSTVQANTDAGFSIVEITGTGANATYGHGLGVKPQVYLVKRTSATGNWVWATSAFDGTHDYFYLNSPGGIQALGYDQPTSSVFQYNDTSGATNIVYCFASKQGFSKIGSYEGMLGSTTPIYTGFKPAFVIIKKTSAENWVMVDAARDPNNPMFRRLFPNLSNAENTGISTLIDFYSNGFRIITNSTTVNSPGTGYIYMAFAENPFVTSTGIPTTAR